MAPVDLNAMTEVRRVQAAAQADEAAEPERQDIAETILAAMSSDEIAITNVAPVVAETLGVRDRTARERINKAIPIAPAYRSVRRRDGEWRLYIRCLSDHSKAPKTIVREWVSD